MAAAERNFGVEERVFDYKFSAVETVLEKKKLLPRQIQFQETKLDKATAQLTSAYQKVLVARCDFYRQACLTSMAKVEQRDATLRCLRRRLRRLKKSALWPSSSWFRKALV